MVNLINRLSAKGEVTVAEFMEEVLTNREYGYYTNHYAIGGAHDFITAPEISQLFGEMIGIWCVGEWQRIGSPSEFLLVELGPGNGTLMKDLLRATRKVEGFHEAINLALVEISPKLRSIQQEKLSNFHKISWYQNWLDLPDHLPMIIVANEFFDALPIHQYVKGKNLWYERMVAVSLNTPVQQFVEKPIAADEVEWLEFEYPDAKIGSIVEHSPQSILAIQHLSSIIAANSGAALVIDYGYVENQGYNSTLQAVKNHQFHPIMESIGEADLTAHVDFFVLKRAAEVRGVTSFGVITQREFLLDLCIEQRAEMLFRVATPQQKLSLVTGLQRLIDVDKMGELFKVLVLRG